MYQCEVRPRSGHEHAVQAENEQGSSIRRYLLSTVSFLLFSFFTNRQLRHGVLAVLTGCVLSFLLGCGGVTFNSSSQKGPGSTPLSLR